ASVAKIVQAQEPASRLAAMPTVPAQIHAKISWFAWGVGGGVALSGASGSEAVLVASDAAALERREAGRQRVELGSTRRHRERVGSEGGVVREVERGRARAGGDVGRVPDGWVRRVRS